MKDSTTTTDEEDKATTNVDGLSDSSNRTIKPETESHNQKNELPIDEHVANEVLPLLQSDTHHINTTALAILKDPILTFELLKYANDFRASREFLGISNVSRALGAVGSQKTSSLIEGLLHNNYRISEKANSLYRELQRQSQICAHISKIIAQHTYPRFSDEAEIIGLLSNLGLMHACAKFDKEYIMLAAKTSKPSLICKLESKLGFNVELFIRKLLLSTKMPQLFLGCIDPDLDSKSRMESQLRMTTNAGKELALAHERNKFSRYNPKQDLPPGSAFRILALPPATFEQIIKECSDFLERIAQPIANP